MRKPPAIPAHSPTRRRFLAAGATLPLAQAAHAAGSSRPNILYIMTDQQHAGMMSCTGNQWLRTPAMDSLAAEGTRFELAYASNPVCVPARTAMVTGRYPSYFGFEGNARPERPPEPAELSTALGHLMRAAGYRTVFGGKTHWPRPMTPENTGFEYITGDERDGLADQCAAFLKEKHAQPFLLVASFINPHDICYMAIDAFTKANGMPLRYPQSNIERQRVAEASALPPGVSREDFYARHCPPLPANFGPTSEEPSALSSAGDFRDHVRKHWTAEDWRLHRWAYCRLTERVDSEIGRVLAALRNSDHYRNTLVIFTSDHGDMDAAHGFEHKSLPYDESARVPLIVSWPGQVPAGKIDSTHLISASVDLLPTLCEAAGAAIPSGMPGRSILPVAQGRTPRDWRQDVLIEFNGGTAVRSARYKYSRWKTGERREMLIDMQRDPGEMTNLSGDPKSAGILADHRQRLARLQQAVLRRS